MTYAAPEAPPAAAPPMAYQPEAMPSYAAAPPMYAAPVEPTMSYAAGPTYAAPPVFAQPTYDFPAQPQFGFGQLPGLPPVDPGMPPAAMPPPMQPGMAGLAAAPTTYDMPNTLQSAQSMLMAPGMPQFQFSPQPSGPGE